MEELIYRGILRRFINNKIFFIILSAIIFGISHVLFEENFVNAIVNMIPYSVMGAFFAYIYVSYVMSYSLQLDRCIFYDNRR